MKIRTASFRHETRLLTLDWLGHPKLSVLSNNPIRGAKKAGESLLFGLHHILPGSLSSHPLRRVHVNTMTHLLLSNHSTLCSVNVSGIRSGSLTWPFPERKNTRLSLSHTWRKRSIFVHTEKPLHVLLLPLSASTSHVLNMYLFRNHLHYILYCAPCSQQCLCHVLYMV